MKKHHLWGRKTPGPYTKAGNAVFDGASNAVGKTGSMLDQSSGFLAGGCARAYGTSSMLGHAAVDGTRDFNEWAQENYARFDVNEDKED